MIRTDEKEKHIRRVLFRFSKANPSQTYAFIKMVIRDIMAQLTLEIAKAMIVKRLPCTNRQPISLKAPHIWMMAHLEVPGKR